MIRRLGVVQRYMCSCSVTAAGDLLLVNTSNGVDLDDKLPAPEAPSFIALDKHSGEAGLGRQLAGAEHFGRSMVVAGLRRAGRGRPGDLRRRRRLDLQFPSPRRRPTARPGCSGNSIAIPRTRCGNGRGKGRRNNIVATPVIYEGRVYIGTGQDPEAGEGPGDLWCIDPTRRGDVSPELVVDREGKPVAAAAAAWRSMRRPASSIRPQSQFGGACGTITVRGARAGGQADFKKTMHRALGMAAIQDELLVIGDFSRPGALPRRQNRPGSHWTYDTHGRDLGQSLDRRRQDLPRQRRRRRVGIPTGSQTGKLLAKNDMGDAVYGTPVVAGNVLYIATRTNLFAIAAKAGDAEPGRGKTVAADKNPRISIRG